jgi:hypothetical protein
MAGAQLRLRRLTEGERATVEPARLRQGPVLGLSRPIADGDGRIAQPLVALSTLEAMMRRGSITPRQLRAGEAFHLAFRAAALDALRAADMARVAVCGGGAVAVSGSERAKKAIARAMARLGGEASVAASCAWHVLGLEWSLRDWAAKATRGNHVAASGVLLAVLGMLEQDFGA